MPASAKSTINLLRHVTVSERGVKFFIRKGIESPTLSLSIGMPRSAVVQFHQGEMFIRNRYGKSAPIIIAGPLVSGLTVIEGREPYHIEPHQYAEPSKRTYEISVSTATVTILRPQFGLYISP
jgi:hypothetical protein